MIHHYPSWPSSALPFFCSSSLSLPVLSSSISYSSLFHSSSHPFTSSALVRHRPLTFPVLPPTLPFLLPLPPPFSTLHSSFSFFPTHAVLLPLILSSVIPYFQSALALTFARFPFPILSLFSLTRLQVNQGVPLWTWELTQHATECKENVCGAHLSAMTTLFHTATHGRALTYRATCLGGGIAPESATSVCVTTGSRRAGTRSETSCLMDLTRHPPAAVQCRRRQYVVFRQPIWTPFVAALEHSISFLKNYLCIFSFFYFYFYFDFSFDCLF